jgi:hypothetical protein
MVLFMGEYYIARSYGEEENAIADWYDAEGCNTLVIIDEYLRIERYKEMRGDMSIGITWLRADSKPEEGNKVIFINEAFDDMVQDFILEHWALLGFFKG